MNQEQKKQIFAGVLFLILIGVFVKMFVLDAGSKTSSSSSGGAANTPAKSASPMGVPPAAEAEDSLDLLLAKIEEVSFPYKDEHIDRDPMTPLVQQAKGPGEGDTESEPPPEPGSLQDTILQMRVTGIIWNEYNPMAVVDDTLIRVGHTYDNGVRVVAIDQDRVWFDFDDGKIPVELKEL